MIFRGRETKPKNGEGESVRCGVFPPAHSRSSPESHQRPHDKSTMAEAQEAQEVVSASHQTLFMKWCVARRDSVFLFRPARALLSRSHLFSFLAVAARPPPFRSYDDVEINDICLTDYIAFKVPVRRAWHVFFAFLCPLTFTSLTFISSHSPHPRRLRTRPRPHRTKLACTFPTQLDATRGSGFARLRCADV